MPILQSNHAVKMKVVFGTGDVGLRGRSKRGKSEIQFTQFGNNPSKIIGSVPDDVDMGEEIITFEFNNKESIGTLIDLLNNMKDAM